MDPQQRAVASEFDTYRDTYAATVNKAIGFTPFKVDFFVRAKAEHLRMSVAKRFGADARPSVLDVGCGIGQYHGLIADRFSRIAGVDVSAEAIGRAKENNPAAEYDVYDGARLPFDDDSFDVAFAVCVLHHVPPSNWTAFVMEMHRIVRPGGGALLFEHNPRHPLTMKAVNDCPFDKDAVLVSTREAEELFRQAGFSAIRVEHILTIPAIRGIAKNIDRGLAGLHCGTQYCLEATG